MTIPPKSADSIPLVLNNHEAILIGVALEHIRRDWLTARYDKMTEEEKKVAEWSLDTALSLANKVKNALP